MRLRFHYSLLTLLLLTAAVAVGVKFWRGPHHVVDRSNPQMEDEYTYYRDWDGRKIMDGVRVRRYLKGTTYGLRRIEFDYYQDGVRTQLNVSYRLIAMAALTKGDSDNGMHEALALSKPEHQSDLTTEQKQQYQDLIQRELQTLQQQGFVPDERIHEYPMEPQSIQ